jgi:hypothetical protein
MTVAFVCITQCTVEVGLKERQLLRYSVVVYCKTDPNLVQHDYLLS